MHHWLFPNPLTYHFVSFFRWVPLLQQITTAGNLKRPRASIEGGGSTLEHEVSSNRGDHFETDPLSGPPTKKFINSTDSTGLSGNVNDLATYAAMLTSSSTNQPTNEHHLHNSLISLMNDNLTSQTLNSTGLYASTSAVQFALLAQKQQQQRNAALVAQCLIPQHHAGLLLNPQLRPVSITQSPLLSAYNCPMTVQSILPQQTQLPTTIFPTTNPPLVSNYYEGSPLIMAGTSSQIMSLNNTESPESKVDTSCKSFLLDTDMHWLNLVYYNVFVGDLSQEVTHEMLLKAFEKFGPIIEAKVMIDQSSGKSRSFGFVTYWKQEVGNRRAGLE